MALEVVHSEFTDRDGTVTIGGASQEEVMSPAAKQLAIQTAAGKLSTPGVSGQEVAYPVDAQGETGEDVLFGRVAVAGYQCDYRVAGAL